jgi:hypothetical protein
MHFPRVCVVGVMLLIFGAGPLAISVPDLADELRCPELARRWCQWSELLVRLGEAGLGA